MPGQSVFTVAETTRGCEGDFLTADLQLPPQHLLSELLGAISPTGGEVLTKHRGIQTGGNLRHDANAQGVSAQNVIGILVPETTELSPKLKGNNHAPVIAEARTDSPTRTADVPELARPEEQPIVLLELGDPLVDGVDPVFQRVDTPIQSELKVCAALVPLGQSGFDVLLEFIDLDLCFRTEPLGEHLHIGFQGVLPGTDGGQPLEAVAQLLEVEILPSVGLADHAQTTFVVVLGAVGGGRPDLDLVGLGGGGRDGGKRGDDAQQRQDESEALHGDLLLSSRVPTGDMPAGLTAA